MDIHDTQKPSQQTDKPQLVKKDSILEKSARAGFTQEDTKPTRKKKTEKVGKTKNKFTKLLKDKKKLTIIGVAVILFLIVGSILVLAINANKIKQQDKPQEEEQTEESKLIDEEVEEEEDLTPSPTKTTSPTNTPVPAATSKPTATPVPPTSTPVPPTSTPTPIADTTPPVFEQFGGPDGGPFDWNNFCFPMYLTDNVSRAGTGGILVRWNYNNEGWTGWKNEFAPCYNDVPNGTYTFEAQARDEAGNETAVQKKTFTIQVN